MRPSLTARAIPSSNPARSEAVYTPQDPDTAQWISDALGPKTEVHQQTTYTGHRLAPWLGHVMVADQESSRPLLDAAEICKLPATDAIILVAGFPPFKAKRLKYYERAGSRRARELAAARVTKGRTIPLSAATTFKSLGYAPRSSTGLCDRIAAHVRRGAFTDRRTS